MTPNCKRSAKHSSQNQVTDPAVPQQGDIAYHLAEQVIQRRKTHLKVGNLWV